MEIAPWLSWISWYILKLYPTCRSYHCYYTFIISEGTWTQYINQRRRITEPCPEKQWLSSVLFWQESGILGSLFETVRFVFWWETEWTHKITKVLFFGLLLRPDVGPEGSMYCLQPTCAQSCIIKRVSEYYQAACGREDDKYEPNERYELSTNESLF